MTDATSLLRLAIFAGVLLALLALERRWPRRAITQRGLRWPANLGLVAIDTLVVRLLLPLGAVGAALWAGHAGIGLFHAVPMPTWLALLLSFAALDCLVYWQHRLMHTVPALWRLHRVHHSDIEFDTTTALRFHPLEILLSMLLKMAAVVALGAPAGAVIAFEVALNAGAMFNHSNLRLPPALDRVLRYVLVTPDMHRVHHSTLREEHDRNFGFTVSWWDWLFRSYTAQPRAGHDGMTIGLDQFRDPQSQRLDRLLMQPSR